MCEWLTPNSIMQLDISSYNLKNYELSTSKKRITFVPTIIHLSKREQN